jgi:hypothetical protein
MKLCYIPDCDPARITPLMTVDVLLERANRDLQDDTSGVFHKVMIMRLNWIVNDLRYNPMRKPIVVDQHWHTIVGDTRLMALDVLSRRDPLPVLIKTPVPQGEVIGDVATLRSVLGFGEHSTILWKPEHVDLFQDPIYWFDIGDEYTAGHWLDEDAAAMVMQRYLARADPDFRFTRAWCGEAVDWYGLLD